jgi:hypothetical protein
MILKAKLMASTAAVALLACGLAVSAGWSTAAKADSTDELLEILKKKDAITDDEYKKIKSRHNAETAALKQQKAQTEQIIAQQQQLSAKAPAGANLSFKDGPGEYVRALPGKVGWRVGDVDFVVHGDISFFAMEQFPDSNRAGTVITGGLATTGHNNSNSVRGGLLPSSLQFGLSTNQRGYDIGAYFGMYVGGNNVDWGNSGANSGGYPWALGTSGIDFRQAYGTIGTKEMGTFKFGRDIGIFGAEAILNDATLFGAGSPNTNIAPSNTTLGRIGIGYVYTDFMPQFSYTSPERCGFTWSAGVFTPLNASRYGTTEDQLLNWLPSTGELTGKSEPMVQGRVKYTGKLRDGVKLTAWTSFVEQGHQAEAAFGTHQIGDEFRSWGWDGGARVDWGNLTLVGYGYAGSGLGTTGLFLNGFSLNGNARDSQGGYVQGSYAFTDRLSLGGSWGISELDLVSGETKTNTPNLVKQNESEIAFAKYKLTNWVNLQAEYVHSTSENHAGRSLEDDAIVAGTTFFW